MKDKKTGKELDKNMLCKKCGENKVVYFYIFNRTKNTWSTDQTICQGCGNHGVFEEIECVKTKEE